MGHSKFREHFGVAMGFSSLILPEFAQVGVVSSQNVTLKQECI
jgi:hypothetical protein